MTQDSLLIAKAILALKQDGNFLKDYIFPIAMSLFSALVGGCVAFFINMTQDSRKRERERYFNANKLIFKVVDCSNFLVSAKSNYLSLQSRNPYERAFLIPEMLIRTETVSFDISDYGFISNRKTCNFTLPEKVYRFFYFKILKKPSDGMSKEELGKSWRNLARINALIYNYNLILFYIEKRNKLDEVMREVLMNYLDKEPATSVYDACEKCFSRKSIINLIDISEMIISLIDHLIIEMDSFIKEFPLVAESNIELSMVGKGVKVIKVDNNRPMYLKCLEPVEKPDFNELAKILGGNLDDIKFRYTFSSWY